MKKYLLGIICIFFLITRLYKIGDVPSSVYWDEASIGYNAYSIAQTGLDERGQIYPLHFKAFGETKLPIYIYATALSTKIFGLNEFSVRLPAVLFSLGTVIAVFFLSEKVFGNTIIGLLSSFLLTISPWFFIFSRTGYEGTAGLFFFLLGILCWLQSKTKTSFLPIASISFILSAYSYNGFRILFIVLFPALLIWLRKSNFSKKSLMYLGISLLLIFISILPIILSFDRVGGSRLEVIGIFNHSKPEIIKDFFVNYLKHLDPKFLFTQGDVNLRSQQKGFGELYLIEAPFLLMGILTLIRKRNPDYLLVFYLLIISLIPAAVTRESPHALRSIAASAVLSMISSFGIYMTFQKVNKSIKPIYILVVICLFLVMFTNYFYSFITNYNLESFNDWQYGYKQIFTIYSNQFDRFDHLVVTDRYIQPYIFALFYLKFDPNSFRSDVKYNTSIRKATSLIGGFNKFIFTDVNFYNLPQGRSLIFTSPSDRMDEIKPKTIILNPDSSPSVYVYEYKK